MSQSPQRGGGRRGLAGLGALLLLAIALIVASLAAREGTEPPPRDGLARGVDARHRESRDRESRDRESRDRESRDRESRDRESRSVEPRVADLEGADPPPHADPADLDPGPGADHIARYAGRSGRLSPHASPEASPPSPSRSHGPAPHLVAWVASRVAIPGERFAIHARVVGARDERVAPARIAVTLYRDTPADGVELPMISDGDAHRADYVPTLAAHPPLASGAPARVQYLVRAEGDYDGEPYSRSVASWFEVPATGARPDAARATPAHEGGDLVVRVPVHVERAGAYFGYAELWGGASDVPVAFARERVEWPAGDHTLTLLFGGAVIRESGVDGPYHVRNLRFMRVDSIPPHEERPVDDVLTTPAWPATAFR